MFSERSGKRDSDPRPQPWQGCALPTELFPRFTAFSSDFALSRRSCSGVISQTQCKGKCFFSNYQMMEPFFSVFLPELSVITVP